MAAQLVENIQYFGSDGLPLVGGLIYIGTVGTEPIGNLISIFADEELTIPIANPQTIGIDGFSANKIFIPEKYSLRVNTVLGAQFLLDLNVGSVPETGITVLSNIQGINVINADTSAGITSYKDQETFVLTVVGTNSGTSGVTLSIDNLDPKPIVKNFDQAIDPGDFTSTQPIIVIYNSSNDNFHWTNASVKTKRQTKGSDIPSAISITVPDNDGNRFDITGSATIATINGVPGTEFELQTDSALTFTNSASLAMITSADILTEPGDRLTFFQITSNTAVNTNIAKADGTAVFLAANSGVKQIVTASTVVFSTNAVTTPAFDDTIPQNTEGFEILTLSITPQKSTNRLVFFYNGSHTNSSNVTIVASIFQDSTANALTAQGFLPNSPGIVNSFQLNHEMQAGTTSLTTFNIRIGASAGTIATNGTTSARIYGGVLTTRLIIMEFEP
jgi:hypothetical protein